MLPAGSIICRNRYHINPSRGVSKTRKSCGREDASEVQEGCVRRQPARQENTRRTRPGGGTTQGKGGGGEVREESKGGGAGRPRARQENRRWTRPADFAGLTRNR